MTDDNQTAYETVKDKTASGDVDASELLESSELREKLRRVKRRRMVGWGPQGIIYGD